MKNEIEIKIPVKFSSKNLKKFIESYWNLSETIHTIIINFNDTEWVTLEGKLFLISFFRRQKQTEKNIFIILPNPNNTSLDIREWQIEENRLKSLGVQKIEERKVIFLEKKKKRRGDFYIMFFIEWKFLKEVGLSNQSIIENHDIDNKISFIDSLELSKVIPFTVINCNKLRINDVEHVQNECQKLTNIDEEILKILKKYGLESSFTNKILSNVITNELILNVALHAYTEKEKSKECFFAVQLNPPIKYFSNERFVQNINEERINEHTSFFNNPNLDFEERAFLEIGLMDFGNGIGTTLFDKFKQKVDTSNFATKKEEDQILEYAFELTSSRNSFEESILIHDLIPRGLYFLLEVIKFYSGSLLVRSRKSRLLFDFSKNKEFVINIEDNNEEYEFPGTMYNILIPDIKNRITPFEIRNIQITNVTVPNIKFIAKHLLIIDLQSEIGTSTTPAHKIAKLISKIDVFLDDLQRKGENYIVYLDFASVDSIYLDFKLFFYLCNTPKIDKKVNLVVINYPSSKEFLDILSEIRSSISTIEPFIFKPIPCIYLGESQMQKEGKIVSKIYDIKWIGLKYGENEELLSRIIKYGSEEILEANKFRSPNLLDSQFINVEWIDKSIKSGNVKLHNSSTIPKLNEFSFKNCLLGNEEQIIKYIIKKNELYEENNLIVQREEKKLIIKEYDVNGIFLKSKKGEIFLTAGGYFQSDFVRFLDTLNDEKLGKRFARYLLNKYIFERGELPEINAIISVTLSSSRLAKYVGDEYSLKKALQKNEKPKIISLQHYLDFDREETLELLNDGDKVFLVNDVISTGNLVNHLVDSIEHTHGATVVSIFTLVDTRVDIEELNRIQPNTGNNLNLYQFQESIFSSKIDNNLISLASYKISKTKNNPYKLKPIRINPIINSPETESISNSQIKFILFHENIEDILSQLDESVLKLGYIKNNHHYHYYTFDTSKLFQTREGIAFVRQMILKVDEKNINIKYDALLYPTFSPVDEISKEEYKYDIFDNPDMEIFPILRVNTDNGWRVPLTNIFKNYSVNKPLDIFIFDDGSCSGDTLVQLIDLVGFLKNLNSITVLSLFGRLEDFEREFFSRISKFRINGQKDVDIKIFFATHLHFPFFTFKNCPFLNEYDFIENSLNNTNNNTAPIFEKLLKNMRLQYKYTKVENTNFERFKLYFPTDENEKMPIKQIFQLRNEIGKIQGYRVFEEYFESVQKKMGEESNIYILIGLLNFEPELLRTIEYILPDVYMKLKDISYTILQSDNFKFYSNYVFSDFAIIKFLMIINFEEVIKFKNFIKLIEYYENIEENEKETIFNYIHYLLYFQLDKSQQTSIKGLLNELDKYYKNTPEKHELSFFKIYKNLYNKKDKTTPFVLQSAIEGFKKDLVKMNLNESHPTLTLYFNALIVPLENINDYEDKKGVNRFLINYKRELENYKSRIEIIKDFCHKFSAIESLYNRFKNCLNDIIDLEVKFDEIIKSKNYSSKHITYTIAKLNLVHSHFAEIEGNIADFFREYPIIPRKIIREIIALKAKKNKKEKQKNELFIKTDQLLHDVYCEINHEFFELIVQELIINSQRIFETKKIEDKNLTIEFYDWKSWDEKSEFYYLHFKQNFNFDYVEKDSGLDFIDKTLRGFGGRLQTWKESTSLSNDELLIVLRKNLKQIKI